MSAAAVVAAGEDHRLECGEHVRRARDCLEVPNEGRVVGSAEQEQVREDDAVEGGVVAVVAVVVVVVVGGRECSEILEQRGQVVGAVLAVLAAVREARLERRALYEHGGE